MIRVARLMTHGGREVGFGFPNQALLLSNDPEPLVMPCGWRRQLHGTTARLIRSIQISHTQVRGRKRRFDDRVVRATSFDGI